MNMRTKELIKVLQKNKLMLTSEEAAAFDNALAELPEYDEPMDEYSNNLFGVFDDGCEHQEVMWGLLHFVESFNDDIFFNSLIKATPKMSRNAQEWLEIFYARVLNSNKSRPVFKSFLSNAYLADQSAVNEVLQKIAANEATPLASHAASVLQT